MNGKFHLWRQVIFLGFVIFTFVFPLCRSRAEFRFAVADVISEAGSLRALAISADNLSGQTAIEKKKKAFSPNSKIVLYVTNLNLTAGEGASAFRVYVEDAKGRKYRFPVLDIKQLEGQQWVYALTVKLIDELGFWKQPEPNGDVLIAVTWRGLASNRLRLGLGKTGGAIKDERKRFGAFSDFSE